MVIRNSEGNRNSRKEGETWGRPIPPVSRPREKIKVYTPVWPVSADIGDISPRSPALFACSGTAPLKW